MRNVFVHAPHPYGTLLLSCCDEDNVGEQSIRDTLSHRLPASVLASCRLYAGHSSSSSSFSSSWDARQYNLAPRLLGGKGGFGSQLRSSTKKGGGGGGGGKSSSSAAESGTRAAMKAEVNGRRVRTLREAESLVRCVRDSPARETAAREEKRIALLRVLASVPDNHRHGDAEMSGTAGGREKFDDDAYIVQSEEILQDIQFALADAFRRGGGGGGEGGDETSNSEESDGGEGDGRDGEGGPSRGGAKTRVRTVGEDTSTTATLQAGPRRLAGWDEDDDDDDDDEEEDCEVVVVVDTTNKGKGKRKVDSRGPTTATIVKKRKAVS